MIIYLLFSLNTAPGSKIKLKVTTAVEHGFLMLNNKNTQLLGGRVDKLAEGWELKKVFITATGRSSLKCIFWMVNKCQTPTNSYHNVPKFSYRFKNAVIILKSKKIILLLKLSLQRCISNCKSEDPDQTVPLEAILSGSQMFI